jgi:hypothetical protein
MPGATLFLDPELTAKANGALLQAEQTAKSLVDEVQETVALFVKVAQKQLAVREWLIDRVEADESHVAQSQRDALLASMQKDLENIRRLVEIFPLTQQRFNGPVPGGEELLQLAEEIGWLESQLREKWQTPEDLERLALKWLSLPLAELKELAKRYPPNPAWFDEDELISRREV